MPKRSFIDLTALLDVVLILFFAALLNIANKNTAIETEQVHLKEQLQASQQHVLKIETERSSLKSDIRQAKKELIKLYGKEAENIKDYRKILDEISMIEIALVGEDNLLQINDKSTHIHITQEHMINDERLKKLDDKTIKALEKAFNNRQKGTIVYVNVAIKDADVYKYAADYLMLKLKAVINQYGKDKVILSTWKD